MDKKRKIIPIFVPHIGCKNNCIFCNQRRITGRINPKIDSNYVNTIVNDYLKTMEEDIIKEIAFFGGSFTAINIDMQKELLNAAYKFKNKGVINNIRISTRPDAINNEILELQKKYGVDIIELGIQSLDEDVLNTAKRGHSIDDCKKASKLIKEYEFILGHQIMPGLPKSNKNIDVKTCRESVLMKPKIARIYPTLVIKDTELEQMYNEGMYESLNISEAVDICAEIYSIYKSNDVNVIRIGLQNTENINLDNDVVAGPFHPAFRQLVEEKIFLNILIKALTENKISHSIVTIKANEKLFSKLIGQKRNNIKLIKTKFKLKKVEIVDWDVKNQLMLFNDNKNISHIMVDDAYTNYVKTCIG